ncbi:DUF4917 family protein, partial [Cronobacter turicensis]|nr:DUF4917 family protein [Cronobacter turicensis]ELY7544208.1 DUF4917 family protein [Cronobacter turicensis]
MKKEAAHRGGFFCVWNPVSARLCSFFHSTLPLRFFEKIDTVISLNYDFIVYWTMLYGLNIPDRHRFKDSFLGGSLFAEDWQRLKISYENERGSRLIFIRMVVSFYIVIRVEQERKIHIRDSGLLKSI